MRERLMTRDTPNVDTDKTPDLREPEQATLLTTLGTWSPLKPDAGVTDSAAIDFLRDVLQAETLVVLTGLGTSLGIRTSVGTAPTMAALLKAVQGLGSYQHVQTDFSSTALKNVESMLSESILHNQLTPDARWVTFIEQAERQILTMCQFVQPSAELPIHEKLLRTIARRSPKLPRAQLFTTNYDLAFEVAAGSTRTTVVDGFSWAGVPVFDGSWFDVDFVRQLPDRRTTPEMNVLHLLKLHGSVGWDRDGSHIIKTHSTPKHPVLIYPSQDKYQWSYQQPYQELIARLQIALRQPGVGVLIIGYGFNDEHINAPILNAIRANVNLKLVAVSPGMRSPAEGSLPQTIQRYIIEGDSRLALIAGTFKDLVEMLPTLEQGDDRDEHFTRVERVDAIPDGLE
ncbi:SIR2 family protein [Clavibacter michiganensis]|uniref:SIR2 family protein n=2 Tax=Clavibacter michiganensis TaxID=28447 RepID=UPI00292D0B41|nr:SIR2 family protein [Clavibacter michiganensis]